MSAEQTAQRFICAALPRKLRIKAENSHFKHGGISMSCPGKWDFSASYIRRFRYFLCRYQLSEEKFKKVMHEPFLRLYDKAKEMGGKISGEYGVGCAKREFSVGEDGEVQVQLMKRIKLAFDPKTF